jgi:two-component system response regulator AlgR
MKIILADDEPLARDRLRRLLTELSDYELIAEAGNGADLLTLVARLKPDVVLLDIHMPGTDGLQVARELAQLAVPPTVIFTTAHSEHALSAFDTAAAYLLKPIRREDLANALQRAQQPSRAQIASLQAASLSTGKTSLLLSTGRSQLRIPASQIICCLADQKLTLVIHRQGEGWCDESLQELESRLGNGFLRVHRSALVAIAYIQGIAGSGAKMRLALNHCSIDVPVSRRRLPALRSLLRQ